MAENYSELVKKCDSKAELCRQIGFPVGTNYKRINNFIEKHKLNISHFDAGKTKMRRYDVVEKICPVCKKVFETRKGSNKEKITCSYSCSNTHFRTGEMNPNWKESSYRSTCFMYHNKECVVCKENKIVDVHHFDEDKKNNSPENLIPLCPTHHGYWHSRYKGEILDRVVEYRNEFINSRM